MAPQAIVLVGPPGSGKTSTGQVIARNLDWSFVDTDRLIEKREGLSVSEVFARSGEQMFRQLESQVLIDLAREGRNKIVVATGGGIVITAGNFELMRQLGPTICLMARLDVLTQRLAGDNSRPLLQDGSQSTGSLQSMRDKLGDLLEKRLKFYAQASTTVDSSDLSVEEVAEAIIEQLGLG